MVYVDEGSTGATYAFKAVDGTRLWTSAATASGASYAAPIVAHGRVFVGSWDGFTSTGGGTLRAYAPGTAPPPPPPPPPASGALVGDKNVEGQVDYNPAGQAEAFQAVGVASGTASQLQVYVDAASAAATVKAGLYADAAGHPGALLASGNLNNPTSGAWNAIPIAPTSITSGTAYWFAVLGPTGTATLKFRDKANGGCKSEVSAQVTLSDLPSKWTSGPAYGDCPVSRLGAGPVGTCPGNSGGSWV